MITLTDYTTYAEVRAVLGVSSYELSDTTLGLATYTRSLYARLRAVTGTFGVTTGSLIDIFEVLVDVVNPTAAQEDMLALIKQFATFIVAESCLTGLSLLAMKSESDGKTTQTRFSAEATFKDVAMNVRQQLNSLIAQLDRALGGADTALPLLSVVVPATDRVLE